MNEKLSPAYQALANENDRLLRIINERQGSDIANHSEEPLGVVEPTLAEHCKQCAEVVKTWPESKRDCLGKVAAPVVERQEPVSDWAIDNSAGRPILVFKKCSVIEAEDAEYILGLVRRDRERQEPVAWVDPAALKHSENAKQWVRIAGSLAENRANGYTQPLFTSPPAPVAVRKLEMADVVRAHMEIPNCPVMTSNQCHALAVKLNACLDKVKELNQ